MDVREENPDFMKESRDFALALATAAARLNQELTFRGVCDAICVSGPTFPGVVLGWVGLLDAATRSVVPVASWGREAGYLSAVRITADDSPTGRGPTGVALTTGQVSVVDSVEDPRFAPWRDEAVRRGYRSAAAFPLKDSGGSVIGVLCLYSGREGFFDPWRTALFGGYAEASALAMHNARLHEEMQRHAEELEGAVRDRTRQLQDKNEELERSNATLSELSRYKSEFLSNMSHELRSPLTAILGFTEVLRDELYGPLNGKQKEHLGHIWQAGRHLLDVIDDVLELSRIEAGRTVLDIADCYPRQVIEAAMALLGQMATTHGVKLDSMVDPDAEIPVRADARKLKQVVFNLGSHAVKTAGPGGSVVVRASIAGQELLLSVEEHHPGTMGLPGAGSTPPRRPGGGLGMNLAFRLTELHGGRVETCMDDLASSAWVVHLPLRGPATA